MTKKGKKEKDTRSDRQLRQAAVKATPEKSPEQMRATLRRMVRMFYDLQRLRLQTEGRLTPKAKDAEIQLHEADIHVLNRRMENLHTAEKNALTDIQSFLNTIPFYRQVLSDKTRYKGIGPTLAGVILSEFDIEKEDTPSKMWSFAGLAPIPVRRCKECHCTTTLQEKEIKTCPGCDRPMKTCEVCESKGVHPADPLSSCEICFGIGLRCPAAEHIRCKSTVSILHSKEVFKHDFGKDKLTCSKKNKLLNYKETFASGKSKKPKRGEKLPYNAFLKSKMIGVMGPCLLKANSPFREYYDNYKHRKETSGWGMTDLHRHNAAIRYMVKMVLLDIWREWRTFEGLPVRPSYHEEKQGGHGYQGGAGSSPFPTKTVEELAIEEEIAINSEEQTASSH